MSNEYREALQRIADGEPGPQAIAEEALENGSGPGSGEVESYPALRWRDDPPAKPGWYAMRRKGDEKMEQVAWIRSGEPNLGDTDEELSVQTMGNSVTKSITAFPAYEWAGPISEVIDEAESAG